MTLPRSLSFLYRLSPSRVSAWKWLYVGIGVKRWLLLLFVGITFISLGAAYVLVQIYREQPFPDFVSYLTLQFLPRPLRAILFASLGIGVVTFALYKLNESLLAGFPTRPVSLVENLYRKRMRQRGLKIVCLGGGTGMSTLLRGLKNYTDNLTAIITVADDGGSSGTLRSELGVLPPGDFRQCIAALADAEPLMARLLEYRFPNDSGLGGHAFGNLLIAAMAGVTGNSEHALLESSRVLAVRGRILPSTLENVTLCAEVRGTREAQTARVSGESQIAKFGQPVERVFLEPERVPAYPGAVRAILDADLVIAGPGSLYTSVLPNLLVEDICAAVSVSPAKKLFVCNVATEHGETDGYAVEDYLDALSAHCRDLVFDGVLVNNNLSGKLPPQANIEFVQSRESAQKGAVQVNYAWADVIDEERPWRHDSEKLARAVLRWYTKQTKRPVASEEANRVNTEKQIRQGSREQAFQ
ncbi:MAG TPA: gluconeogenesis factor YvcK family protein [Anaerolineae bacterium]|nr:gluconeogenesis factor YvcK family protein [Anaerolineae bacterium]